MVDIVTYGMACGYTDKEISEAQLSPYNYKGTCTAAELAAKTGMQAGDCWVIAGTGSASYPLGSKCVYNGTAWSVYEQATYSKSETDALLADKATVAQVNAKSTVSVSATGTATDEVNYIIIDGVEKKIAGSGGGGTSDFDQLTNRPSYNGTAMTHETDIPEVKTAEWDAKQAAITDSNKLSSDLVDATGHTNQFVTAGEKSTWNAKASTATATTSANGLMSSTDKAKLDGLAAVSGTNDGTNWSTITIGSTTKNIPSGGSGSSIHTYRL